MRELVLLLLRHGIPTLQHIQAELMANPDLGAGNGHRPAKEAPGIERQLKISDVAELMGCSVSHVTVLCERGELGCHRSGRWIRVGESQLQEYLARITVKPVGVNR